MGHFVTKSPQSPPTPAAPVARSWDENPDELRGPPVADSGLLHTQKTPRAGGEKCVLSREKNRSPYVGADQQMQEHATEALSDSIYGCSPSSSGDRLTSNETGPSYPRLRADCCVASAAVLPKLKPFASYTSRSPVFWSKPWTVPIGSAALAHSAQAEEKNRTASQHQC